MTTGKIAKLHAQKPRCRVEHTNTGSRTGHQHTKEDTRVQKSKFKFRNKTRTLKSNTGLERKMAALTSKMPVQQPRHRLNKQHVGSESKMQDPRA